MTSILLQRLAQFVDRESEIRQFESMLEDDDCTRPIMTIWGEGGMGKSSLLLRMGHECSIRRMRKAEIFWSDTRGYEYMNVLRKIRDDLGAEGFNEFTSLLNFYTAPQYDHRLEVTVRTAGDLSVAQQVNLNQGTMNALVIQEGAIVVRDLMFPTPRGDLAISEVDRRFSLTEKFIAEMSVLARSERIVLFFDGTEKASEITLSWLWNDLFGAFQSGRLDNVRVVICGRSRPAIDDHWWNYVEESRLEPLQREHIIEYIGKHRLLIPEGSLDIVVDLILANTSGNPLGVAGMVSAYSKMKMRQQASQ